MPTTYKNEVHLSGVLAKDASVKYTPTGKAVANLTVLTKYEKYSEFHRVTAWEELAEKVAELKKGDFVKVVGRLQTRSWEDQGQKRYSTEVVAFSVSLLCDDPKPLTPDQGTKQESRKGGTATARAILEPPNIHGQHITDEDIPF